jgi:DNA ligase 1
MDINMSDFAMSAHHYSEEDVKGWYASRKLNGWHGVWIPKTRGVDLKNIPFYKGKVNSFASGLWTLGRYSGPQPIYAPAWWLSYFPDFPVEGELWSISDSINEVKSICGQGEEKSNCDQRWTQISFMAFNEYFLDEKPTYNWKHSQDKLKSCGNRGYFKILEQTELKENDPYTFLHFLGEHVEGAMLIDPGSWYEHKRSKNLLKVKHYYDNEATIIGWFEGKGKNIGIMGGVVVELTWDEKITSVNGGNSSMIGRKVLFEIGGGFSDSIRKEWTSENTLGKIINFRYWGVTPIGIPISANYSNKEVLL